MQITQTQSLSTGKLVAIALAGLLVVAIFFLFFVLRSTPGNSLYAFKVNTVEEVIEHAYVSPSAKAGYHLSVMERRLAEIEVLAKREPVNEGDIGYLYQYADGRARELIALLAAEEGQAFSRVQALEYTNELATTLRLMEEVAKDGESTVLATGARKYRDLGREVAAMYKNRAEQLSAHGTPEEVTGYLQDLLTELLAKVDANQMSSDTRESIVEAVAEAQTEIVALDTSSAMIILGEALRLTYIDEHYGYKPDPEPEPEEELPEAEATVELITSSSSETGEGVPVIEAAVDAAVDTGAGQ